MAGYQVLAILVLAVLIAIHKSEHVEAAAAGGSDKVVCYYGGWTAVINRVDPHLCTHLIYSFALLDKTSLTIKKGNENQYKETVALRNQNPNLKVLLAVGGWTDGSVGYSKMAMTEASRANFINSAHSILNEYNFDGLDLDWEYPAQRGGASSDKKNFVKLVQEMRSTFGNGLLITAAVQANVDKFHLSYDVPEISKYLDFINVMTYDLRGPWDGKTGIHCGLYPRPQESAQEKKLTTSAAIDAWLAAGAPSHKLILGIPTYGKGFVLRYPAQHGFGAPTVGGSDKNYDQICEMANGNELTVVRNNYTVSPYAYAGNQWIGYDDAASAFEKGKYARSKALGGVMFWSVEKDDIDGSCGHGNFPVIRNAAKGLNANGPVIPITSQPVTNKPVTGTPVVTEKPISNKDCNSGYSYFCDPQSTAHFFQCVHGQPVKQSCGPGTNCMEYGNSIACV